MGARQSVEMAKAKKLILEKGMTPYAAAQATGISRAAIYMSRWYKEYLEAKTAVK